MTCLIKGVEVCQNAQKQIIIKAHWSLILYKPAAQCPFTMTLLYTWAVTRDFQQCGILTSVDSDEPVQPLFKLRNSKWCSVSSLTLKRLAKALIRLRVCAGWSEASLVAHTTLLEIQCHGSIILLPRPLSNSIHFPVQSRLKAFRGKIWCNSVNRSNKLNFKQNRYNPCVRHLQVIVKCYGQHAHLPKTKKYSRPKFYANATLSSQTLSYKHYFLCI